MLEPFPENDAIVKSPVQREPTPESETNDSAVCAVDPCLNAGGAQVFRRFRDKFGDVGDKLSPPFGLHAQMDNDSPRPEPDLNAKAGRPISVVGQIRHVIEVKASVLRGMFPPATGLVAGDFQLGRDVIASRHAPNNPGRCGANNGRRGVLRRAGDCIGEGFPPRVDRPLQCCVGRQ